MKFLMKIQIENFDDLQTNNLLILISDETALQRIKDFLQVPIVRIQMGYSDKEIVQINGIQIHIKGSPFAITIKTKDGKEITLDQFTPASDQILEYLRKQETAWEYGDFDVVMTGEEGLDRKIFELRKGTAKPIKLTISVGENEKPADIQARLNAMIDRLLKN